jgi:hypothetical protein
MWLAAQSSLLDRSLIYVLDHIMKETYKKTTKEELQQVHGGEKWEKRRNIVE